tara:strand:+ start:896 stop:1096 length:201 start_codon:yes stop_codon:yes gene_type:complete
MILWPLLDSFFSAQTFSSSAPACKKTTCSVMVPVVSKEIVASVLFYPVLDPKPSVLSSLIFVVAFY